MQNYTYIDLFCGPGGLSTGFKNSGFKPLIAVEISDWTVKTYSKNHDVEVISLSVLLANKGNFESILSSDLRTCLIHGDVRNVSDDIILEILNKKFKTNTVDVVVGCPPCESFSMAGLRLEVDDRNDLFSNILRIAHCTNSKFVFFENVSGLLTKKRDGSKGGQFQYIINQFETPNSETGNYYKLASKNPNEIKLLATDYGVPQKRERLFLVGCNSKYQINTFRYPEKTHGRNKHTVLTVSEAFYNLPIIYSNQGSDNLHYKLTYNEDYQNNNIKISLYNFMRFICGEEGYFPSNTSYDRKTITSHKAAKHKPYMIERFKNTKQGESMLSAVKRLRNEGKEDIVNNFFPKKLFAARGRTLIPNEPSFTVTSHCFDEMLHPFCNRAITAREAARLQTFPDWYQFEGPYTIFHSSPEQDKYEQIGDAVPVLLARALGNSLHKAIDELLDL